MKVSEMTQVGDHYELIPFEESRRVFVFTEDQRDAFLGATKDGQLDILADKKLLGEFYFRILRN